MQQFEATLDNQPAPVAQVIRRFIDGLCHLDADEAIAGLSDDARLSMSSESFALGKARVRSALVRAMACLYSIHCEPAVVWIRRNIAIVEADVNCERIDRARMAFPVTLVLRFRDHQISEIRLLTYEPAVIGNFRALTAYSA